MAIDRGHAIELLERLHAAQNEYYAGGAGTDLRRILAPEIEWTIPGDNAIAGTYRGIDEVIAYFARRRDLAGRTFRMQRRDILVGETNRVAALTDGTATINGTHHQWSTVGLYDIDNHDRIAACWLLALDQHAFDTIWSR
ncbi:MAG: nuclear transport factor 2 family protein [Solirubrobacteraceae bacterium MAG38_C4-C5]|nr:nuclear transport factor 2 family protein [Candidatus Siliceabacter maunaloa]